MKTSIIGIGNWGTNLLKELDKQSEVVYACHTGSIKNAEILSQYPNIRLITDPNIIWNDKEVEAVIIATPTNTHFELGKKSLKAGKHLFLEKPGCESGMELKELCEMAENRVLKFAVGYEFPHHVAAQKIRGLIDGHKILSIHFNWLKWGTFKDSSIPHLLCHDISLAKYWGIEPFRVIAVEKEKIISDTDILKVEFESDGTKIYSSINRTSPIKQKMVTINADKSSYAWNGEELFEVDKENQSLKEIELVGASPVEAEMRDFLGSVKKSGDPLVNGRFALQVYRTIEEVQNFD
jgi:UDP-2-acetamido-3-amino-2,3-dideoxy-glucuronate N-acetyltransferase